MRARRLWVFAHDPDGLTVALVREEAGGRVRLLEWQRAEAVGDDAACEQHIAAALSGSSVRDAIVISWQAKAAIVHPPLAAAQEITRFEMHGLIGWELEPLLPAGEELQVACAWNEPQDTGTLASGIRLDRLEWWKRVLSSHRLRLRGILPDAGATIANAPAGRCAVVEISRDQLTRVVLRGNTVLALDTLPLRAGERPQRVLDELTAEDPVDEVLTSSRGVEVDSGRLDARCDYEGGAGDLGGAVAWVCAAARTYWASTRESAALPLISARVSASGSGRLRLVLLAIALAAGIASAELWLRGLETSARADLIAAQAPLQEQRRLRGRVNGSRAQASALRAEVAELRQRADAVRDRLDRLDSFGPRRARTLPALLDALARSISANAVVERVVEKTPGVVCVEGSAGSERAVQQLTKDLAVAMRPFDFRVTKQEIRELRVSSSGLPFSYVLVMSPQTKEDA